MAKSYAYLAVLFIVIQLAAAQTQVTYNRYITSRNGRNNISTIDSTSCLSNNYGRLQVQIDGNLCAYYGTKINFYIPTQDRGWWCSNDQAKPQSSYNTILREDGKLCTYPSSTTTYNDANAVWCSSNAPGPTTNVYFTLLQNDGNICTYSGGTWQNPRDRVWCAGVVDPYNRLSLIVTSNPQMPSWQGEVEDIATMVKDVADLDQQTAPYGSFSSVSRLWLYGKARISQQYKSINWLIDNGYIYNPQGIIVNGDLTAEGDPAQLEEFKKQSSVFNGKQWVYKGIGSWDYRNAENSEKAAMFDWIANDIKQIPTLQSRHVYDSSVPNRLSGSLSYSFDIGPLHIIQLQIQAGLDQDFTYNGRIYQIKQSLDWLRTDLMAHQFKIIMINMNLYQYGAGGQAEFDTTEFDSIIRQYPNVAAIFSGHAQQHCGIEASEINGDKVPRFRSGSAAWGCYLTAEFNFGTLDMTVRRVVNDKCGYAHYNMTNIPAGTKSYMTATCGLGSKQKENVCNVNCQSNNGQSCSLYRGRSPTICSNGLDLPW